MAQFPVSDASVTEIRRRETAYAACRTLLEAYRRGEEAGGSIDWDDINLAYEMALKAAAGK